MGLELDGWRRLVPRTGLKADIRKLGGSVAIVESTADQWGTDGSGRGPDWEVKRIGAQPPDGLVDLARHASFEVYAACDLSPALFDNSDGTGQREAWRRALFGVISPLGRIVENELRVKLGQPDLRITWDELRASDLAGRARAFQSMVGGGIDAVKAASLAGLMEPE